MAAIPPMTPPTMGPVPVSLWSDSVPAAEDVALDLLAEDAGAIFVTKIGLGVPSVYVWVMNTMEAGPCASLTVGKADFIVLIDVDATGVRRAVVRSLKAPALALVSGEQLDVEKSVLVGICIVVVEY